MKVTAYNLSTQESRTYVGLEPWKAVRNAYAQEQGDYNTWEYDKYNSKIEVTYRGYHVFCGDWGARIQ